MNIQRTKSNSKVIKRRWFLKSSYTLTSSPLIYVFNFFTKNSTASMTSQETAIFGMCDFNNFQMAISWKAFILDTSNFCFNHKMTMKKILRIIKVCKRSCD